MQNKSRTYNSIVNSLWGVTASALTVILNFVVRIVIVRQLGEEINGINSLFQSVISMMALMEMGISSAMIIHLYEPIKHENHELIAGIMSFYRRVYYYVAVAFTIVGVLVSLFLIDDLVTSSIPTNTVRAYFLVFTACFVVNYLTYYKRSILFAEQKNRISTLSTAICELVFRTLQIFLLFAWQNYYLFLLALMAEKVSSNLICSYYVDKHHSYLRNNTTKLSSEKKKGIFNTVKPLMVFQTATTIQGTVASILISALLGDVSIVGYYGVYQLIINVVSLLFTQLGSAFTTSFGNLSVDGDKEYMMNVFKKTVFIFDLIACVCAAIFIVCVDDFVGLFFGPHFVLDRVSVILITFQMVVSMMIIPSISVQNAMGLHRYVSKFVVIQAIFVILLSWGLGLLWGMRGIIMGTIIPTIVISLFNNGSIICLNAFNMKTINYCMICLMDFIKVIATCATAICICHFIHTGIVLFDIVIKAIVGLIIGVVIPVLLSFNNNKELKETFLLVRNIKSVFHNK